MIEKNNNLMQTYRSSPTFRLAPQLQAYFAILVVIYPDEG